MNTTVTIEGFRCRADATRSSMRYNECGLPAVAGIKAAYRDFAGVQPLCVKHLSGNRRRKYARGVEVELNPQVLADMDVARKEQREKRDQEIQRKRAEGEARHAAHVESEIQEGAVEWYAAREYRQETDFLASMESGTHQTRTVPAWVIVDPDGRPTSWRMGVEVEERTDMPPVLKARISSEITPKQARALARVLLEAAVVAELLSEKE